MIKEWQKTDYLYQKHSVVVAQISRWLTVVKTTKNCVRPLPESLPRSAAWSSQDFQWAMYLFSQSCTYVQLLQSHKGGWAKAGIDQNILSLLKPVVYAVGPCLFFSPHTAVLQHLPHFCSGFEPSMTDPAGGWTGNTWVPLQPELSCGSVSDLTEEMLAWSQAGFEIGTFTCCSLNMKLVWDINR